MKLERQHHKTKSYCVTMPDDSLTYQLLEAAISLTSRDTCKELKSLSATMIYSVVSYHDAKLLHKNEVKGSSNSGDIFWAKTQEADC